MSPPLFEARGVTVLRGEYRVLRRADFAWGPLERRRVTGANGAGKSTLLQLISGAIAPEDGEVMLFGRAADAGAWRELRANLGVLAHHPPVAPLLSVRENVAYWAGLHGDWPASALRDALDWAGLGACAGRPGGALSRGQAQRVGLAVLRVTRKPWLLLDEPATGLDAEGRALLAQVVESAEACLICVHDDAPYPGAWLPSWRVHGGLVSEA